MNTTAAEHAPPGTLNAAESGLESSPSDADAAPLEQRHRLANVAALEDVLLRVSRLVEEVPEICELDLNPVFALPPGRGCRIVDARIRVRQAAGPR